MNDRRKFSGANVEEMEIGWKVALACRGGRKRTLKKGQDGDVVGAGACREAIFGALR
jgi:hypothetical protein